MFRAATAGRRPILTLVPAVTLLLVSCNTDYSASYQQVINIPTNNGLVTERVSVGQAVRIELKGDFRATGLVSRASLPSNWFCEEHFEFVEALYDVAVASCDSWSYSIVEGSNSYIVHDIIVETTPEAAEEYFIPFRLPDPVAANAPPNRFEPKFMVIDILSDYLEGEEFLFVKSFE